MTTPTTDLLDQARGWAQETLTDTVALTRDGADSYDDLGTRITTTSEVYRGPGLVQLEASSSRTVVVAAGEQDVDSQGYVLKLATGVDVRRGDTVEVVASLDARQVGRRWRITAVPTQGWAVLRRCLLDVIDPEKVA